MTQEPTEPVCVSACRFVCFVVVIRRPASDSTSECSNPSAKELPVPIAVRRYEQPVTSAARQGCRCGSASIYPFRPVCLGQRCSCYAAGVSCKTCRCKLCYNRIDKVNRLYSEVLHTDGGNDAVKTGADGELSSEPRTHVVNIVRVDE
nr:uncharacterized protein LOC129380186 [Dermacentor andersoni]